jgi:saccharopine dehydrogenase (NAD+, L-lysine forming)
MRRIGIRREDKDPWEARVPLVPDDVSRLIDSGAAEFVVQPSAQRVFSDDMYVCAGARVDEDLSACDIVLAVKEIPRELFRPGATYAFFSHTIKGQPHNMDMLRRLMELECRLLDYERITDDHGLRLVFFSRFAGLAGALDSLWALGRRLEWEGVTPNPFAALEQTYRYPTLAAALEAVHDAGARIAADGLPAELSPFVMGITGYGNVALGAQEVVDALGAVAMSPEQLDKLRGTDDDHRTTYSVVFAERDLVARRDASRPFALDEYYRQPELYQGTFARRLPQLTLLLNCVFWDAPYPRLVTRAAIRELFAAPSAPRLRVIGDISCDIEGSVELTVKETHIDQPVYVYDAMNGAVTDGVEGRGPVVLAVSNLPCELSRESSIDFSAALSPFVPALAAADLSVPYHQLSLPPELRRALILHHGALTPDYEYLRRFVTAPPAAGDTAEPADRAPGTS